MAEIKGTGSGKSEDGDFVDVQFDREAEYSDDEGGGDTGNNVPLDLTPKQYYSFALARLNQHVRNFASLISHADSRDNFERHLSGVLVTFSEVQADLEQHIYPEKSRAPGKRVRLAFERGGKKKSTKKSTKKRKLQSDEAGNAAADAKGGAEVKTTARCTRSLFGLKNSSKTNTCFMNAWLHCLLSIEPLLQIFSSDCLHICKSSPYAGQLATVFKRLVARARETNDSSVFNPRDIINVVAKLAPRFTGNSHHDSQEFLLFVVWSIITASQLVSRPTNKLMLYDVAKRVAKRLAHFQKLGTYADFDYPGFSCPSIERSMLNGRCCI